MTKTEIKYGIGLVLIFVGMMCVDGNSLWIPTALVTAGLVLMKGTMQ